MKFPKIKTIILAASFFLFVLPLAAAADYGGQKTVFNIDSSYDNSGRSQLAATLLRITPSLYFYLDDGWFNLLDKDKQTEVKIAIQDLGDEFESKIYPTLTKTFGTEWRPGIDKDTHITILLHPIKKEAGGYTNTADEYPKAQVPDSNEREIIYLNSEYLSTPLAKSFLAHEFTHLIIFNQKNRERGVNEEIWLNEACAEYSSTLLGYDEPYSNSNLSRRVSEFLKNSNNSLPEWKNEKADYGVLNLFIQYLVDHYGIGTLVDSLHSKKVGMPSINEALVKNGFSEDFSRIFTDWTIAIFLNDCSIDLKYCYLNKNLKNLQVAPLINFLPLSGKSTLAVAPTTKQWAGNWYKFIGGGGDLKIEFIGTPDVPFKVPYLVQDSSLKWSVNFLSLDKYQQGRIIIPGFGTKAVSVVLIPFIQNKISGFDGEEKTYSFYWSVSTEEGLKEQEGSVPTQTEDIQSLLKKMEFLEKQLVFLREQLRAQLTGSPGKENLTGILDTDLRYGDRNEKVRLLQTWLAKDSTVYPEALVTGYFGLLTQKAVIRFQEKYREEILSPLRLISGTGLAGKATRAKLNALYGK